MKKAVLGLLAGLVVLGVLQWASPMLPRVGGYYFDLSPHGVAQFIGLVKAKTVYTKWLLGGQPLSREQGGSGQALSREQGSSGQAPSREEGRSLNIQISTAVETPNQEWWTWNARIADLQSIANRFLTSPRAYARDDGVLVIEFDVQKGEPIQAVNRRTGEARDVIDGRVREDETIVTGARLLVRLFDRNGQYLTHFITEEIYSLYPAVTGKEAFTVEYTTHVESRRACWMEGCIPLQSEGNHLTYALNQRDLDYTASVEVGFLVYRERPLT